MLDGNSPLFYMFTVPNYTRCHIDTINSPDDGHMAAQNT